MKYLIALLFCFTLAAQQTVNNFTVKTNLTIGSQSSGAITASSSASRSLFASANSLYSIGDSFTYGASATAYTNTYVYKLGSSIGLFSTNIANGSFTIADANWIIFPGWSVTNSTGPSSYVFQSPSSISEDQNFTALIGFNDLRTGAGIGTAPSASRYRLGLDHLITYATIPDSYKRWAVSPDLSTGSWTPSTWVAYTNKAATSSSGTLTFSNVIGSEIYVGFVSWATNYGGTISVSVDGTLVESRSTASAAYGNREYINGTDPVIPNHVGPYGNGKIDFCPHIITASGLGLSSHTVVITASSNPVTVIWVAGNGFKRSIKEGPNLFFGSIPRQYPWTGAGTDALQSAYNIQLRSAINSARSSGLRVSYVPVGEYYNPLLEQDVDGVHPNNAGHSVIASAFEQSMSTEMPQMSGVGYQTEPSQNGSFSSLSVSGTSSLSGNATFGGRLLVLPTATSGGTSSRFGLGSSPQSSVLVSHSDTSLDRQLVVSGNNIYSTVNSTGAGANLSIGTFGFTTLISGNLSVANTATVSSNLTTTGRLLVLPTAQSGGYTHRFGADSSASSSVTIFSGDTALDRRLNLYGNSISAVVNSTGANANMSLGTFGNNVSISGSASITQNLTVSSSGTAMSKIRHGTATLSSGSVTVSDSNVTSSSRIVLTSNTDGGTPGWLRVSARSAGTSFTITSSSATDTSTVAWVMIEP